VVYAGKAPHRGSTSSRCAAQHDPVAIIVRYGKVGACRDGRRAGLKVISKHGSGTDTIDKAAAAERGIQVVAAAGANAAAVAEQAMALLLACAKSVVVLNARMHAGHWDKATHKSVELGGRTVGLVGLGAIGLRFARMADAMGMRVLGFDPYAKALPACVRAVDLATIWREADAISLHCPLTRRQHQAAERADAGAVQAGRDRRQHRPRWPDRRAGPAGGRAQGQVAAPGWTALPSSR
jgi:D-3-phosphoglycerate dehydrogenase